MGIIFVNLKAMENRDNLNVKPQGDTELEKAQYVYEYIKKANDIVFDGVIVTEYGAIIKLIHETYKYESSTTMDIYAECTTEKKKEVAAKLEGKIVIR